MSSIDLIILGLVYERQLSAYDIQKEVEYRQLNSWMKLSIPSIYKKVIRLFEQEYLERKLVKNGKMPEKMVYTITAKGKEQFTYLMTEISKKQVSVFLDINSVIINLNKVPKEEATIYLKNIHEEIHKSYQFIEKMLGQREHIPEVGKTIMQQQYQIFEVLNQWSENFLHYLETNELNKTVEREGMEDEN